MNDDKLLEIGKLSLERAKRGKAYGIINASYKKILDDALDKQEASTQSKLSYYQKRVNDKTLTKKQRIYSKQRIKILRRSL